MNGTFLKINMNVCWAQNSWFLRCKTERERKNLSQIRDFNDQQLQEKAKPVVHDHV